MGTPDCSVRTFRSIGCCRPSDYVLLCPSRIKQTGEGTLLQSTPGKEAAWKYGISAFHPKSARHPQCVEQLRSCHADVYVVAAFGQILPKELLEISPYGCIVAHASLQPKYRGAVPI
ncbi:formyltransferase family protein [Acutalibacter intestini]|uniref:formyltransferase family protein n=1 Tax=Acutalibacter intestini TaxID=3093659 RepID=UPI0034602A28